MPGHAPGPQQRQAGGLMLRTRFFVLAFLLHFFPPSASIDGGPAFQIRWGDNHLPGLPPGHHRIRVWFRYLFFGDCGIADAVIEVPPEGMYLEYKAPTWLVFNKGTFPSLAAPAAPAAAAPPAGAWHPDPTGRAEQRFWDGRAWTGHVVRGGQQAWDPL